MSIANQTKTIITRSERVLQLIDTFFKLRLFTNLNDAREALIVTFDGIELQANEHNASIRIEHDSDLAMETVFMSVPSPKQHHVYPHLYFAIATRHIIIFSDWGAVALYRKILSVYDEIAIYKNYDQSLLLLSKPGACRRDIWGEFSEPYKIMSS